MANATSSIISPIQQGAIDTPNRFAFFYNVTDGESNENTMVS
jgi:predicted transcriptional regulator